MRPHPFILQSREKPFDVIPAVFTTQGGVVHFLEQLHSRKIEVYQTVVSNETYIDIKERVISKPPEVWTTKGYKIILLHNWIGRT